MSEESFISNPDAGENIEYNDEYWESLEALKKPKTLTVTMLKAWPPGKCTWLEPGKEYTIDRALAKMLLAQKKAEFTGDFLELWH